MISLQYLNAVITSEIVPRSAIKWPNDIYIDGAKAGGILCSSDSKSKRITSGIGLNFESIPEIDRKVSSIENLSKSSFLLKFFEHFEHDKSLIDSNWTELFRRVEERWLHSNQSVTITDLGIEGTVQGLSSSGDLKVSTPDGIYEVTSNHHSFDLAAGVISKKQ